MKKVLLRICIFYLSLFAFNYGKAQYITITDTAFVSWLTWNGYVTCLNGNQLDTTCPYVVNTTSLSNLYNVPPITNLNGIQYFMNLDRLYTDFTKLDSIEELPRNLTWLNCSNNYLSKIKSFPPRLKYVDCSYNKFISLPKLPDSLNILICEENKLIILPDLPDSLQQLNCGYNPLHVIPTLPNSLQQLNCRKDSLSSLPTLPNSLRYLNCCENQITSLPELPDTLWSLYCCVNPLNCLPRLKTIISELNFANTNINCLPNYGNIHYSTPLIDTMPLCSQTANPNDCLSYNLISDIASDFIYFFPNPATTTVTINIDETMLGSPPDDSRASTATVSDITGRKITTIKLETLNSKLQTLNFSNGVYLVTVTASDGRSATKKLVVSR